MQIDSGVSFASTPASAVPYSDAVAVVCGDDDVKIDAWRTRVKKRAEQEAGQGSAAEMLPEDLWAILTGERPAPREAPPPEVPAPSERNVDPSMAKL
mgnify:CR=1 FL=1